MHKRKEAQTAIDPIEIEEEKISARVESEESEHAKMNREVILHQLKIQDESWIKTYWRPSMGWLYMAICAFDFIIFPTINMLLPAILKHFGIVHTYQPWVSLTLSNGGMIHLAFGAILGVAAWTRGQEKISLLS